MNATRVAAIVLNWRGADDTLACLKSLHAQQRKPDTICVIDNASDDDSVARIQAAYPHVELAVNAKNEGYGRGHNPTLERLLSEGYTWLWLVNNDAEVRNDGLKHLLEHAGQQPAAGAIGAMIYEHDRPDQLQACGGGRVDWWLGRSSQFLEPVEDARLDYITGACLFLRADALRQIGLFDPAFFMYWEDVDLCLRLKQAGWSLSVAPQAHVLHRSSGSLDHDPLLKDRLMNASAVHFFRTHGAWGGWPALAAGIGGRVMKRVLSGRWAAAGAVMRGAMHGLRKRA